MKAHRSRSRAARLVSVVTSLAVVLVLLGTGVASAHFPQSIDNTIPGNGQGASTSSAIPTSAKQGTIASVPATAGDEQGFNDLSLVLAGLPTKGSRFLFCFYFSISPIPYPDEIENFEEAASTLFLLFLKACLDLAAALSPKSAAFEATPFSASATSGPCFRAPKQIAIKITHANGKYTLHAKGMTKKPTKLSPASMSCQIKNHGALLSLKPRVKGKKLRQVVGPNLGIGFLNRGSKKVTVKTTFAVK